MEKEVIFNSNLHFEHQIWESELAFWEDELQSFKYRLEELVERWTDKDVLAKLEHYQNEFIVQSGVIDELKEAIEQHEIRMAGQSEEGQEILDIAMVKKHSDFRNEMETQRVIYDILKKNFLQFLSKYM